MRRHSSIQLLLLSLTGCSWMLLFLTLTLSDYHAFKTYHASHVAAAHTTVGPVPKEIDPCDLCFNVGANDPKEFFQEPEEGGFSGLAQWGTRLANAWGIGSPKQQNATPTPTVGHAPGHAGHAPGHAGGVGAFYYYTLHTAFTSLQVRLKKAQLVAGDAQADVAILEEKVGGLHDILVTQFSPRADPYDSKLSFIKLSVNTSHPAKSTSVAEELEKQAGNAGTVQKDKRPVSLYNEQRRSPSSDIYALLHGQTQVVDPITSPKMMNQRKIGILAENSEKLHFQESRQLLSFSDVAKEKIADDYKIKGKTFHNTNEISERNHRFVVEDNVQKEDSGKAKCETWKTYPRKTTGQESHFLSITGKDIANFVSVIIMDQGKSGTEAIQETLANLYPGIAVHFITSSTSIPRRPKNLRVMIHHMPMNATLGSSYMVALDYVKTPYVFIATNISGLSSPTSIERLVWATEYLGVWASSAALLSPSGSWHLGCMEIHKTHYQMTWHRHRLGTAAGYVLCDSLEGPFLAVTSALRYLRLDDELPSAATQLDLFMRASQLHNMLSAVCPQEVMTIVHELRPPPRASLLSFAKTHDLYTIQVPPGVQFRFNCDEVTTKCGLSSFVLSPCCRMELARLVRFLMDTCDAHGLLCELQEGTLLGAVKTGGVIPWEKDADVTFHTTNFTALGELKDVFERAGYSLHLVDNRWCCVDGRWAGGQGTLNTQHWSLELYSQHVMDSEDDLLARRPRTRIQFDGSWVTAPTSPGLYVRNRYGTELYRHAQHWLDTGRRSGWEEYESGRFLPCITPSHHACLDEYLPDGNLKFRPPCLV